jgi:hypothetical protein
VDSFQVCTRCGLSPNARQIREIADCDIPAAFAIDRVDQCVSPLSGFSSKVLVITASTCSSVIVRGAPGRGSSVNPSSRCATNRERHLATVSRAIPNSAAISVFDPPRAHARMILERCANAWAVLRRRAHCSNITRSSSVNSTTTGFAPRIRLLYRLETSDSGH